MRNTETGLISALEAALKAASEPLDAQALYDMPAVKQHAASTNRVSDYLGNLWRKGLVTRRPADRVDGSRSKWMYTWVGSRGPKLFGTDETIYAARILADKPSVLITEEGNNITLEFANLIILVKQKPNK